MHIHRDSVDIVIQTPAKLNLFFEVLRKRADGFHEIETLMVPIGLYDSVFFKEDSSELIQFNCNRVENSSACESSLADGQVSTTSAMRNEEESVPDGRTNLVYRAVELLRRRAQVRSGARLRLVKRIPTAAGLGGGSSDAAAALIAANKGWKLNWSTAELAELAAELGSDVPFFLHDGPAVCRGRGERIEPIDGLGALCFVVVRPPVGLSTADVYRACTPVRQPRELTPILDALRRGDLAVAGRLLFNRLQPTAAKLCHWICKLESEFQSQDCFGHIMSGSGTCYFGLCQHMRHARRVAGRLQARGMGVAYAVQACR
ncbi:MAG: 4-(cytidine 5'-diphospho)-2-C-methyl-D-erythritol kinase [Pirellulales bacterium]|nr:4-(cytidine 5'-diphospho)-2-C-methyl-D-erythritol kinase [Pirellulales bacterium]